MNFTKTLLLTLCITASTASFAADTVAAAQKPKTSALQQTKTAIKKAVGNFISDPTNYFYLGAATYFGALLFNYDKGQHTYSLFYRNTPSPFSMNMIHHGINGISCLIAAFITADDKSCYRICPNWSYGEKVLKGGVTALTAAMALTCVKELLLSPYRIQA